MEMPRLWGDCEGLRMICKEEIIWVDKEFAEKWKKLCDEEVTRDQQEKVFNEYMESVSEAVRRDFKANLEAIEEDAAIFSGLMLKTRQVFEKVKNEQLSAAYNIWEGFENDIIATNKKVDSVLATLKPLTEKLQEVESLYKRINTFSMERFIGVISSLSSTYGEPRSREMVEFLVKHFGKEKETPCA
jgi:hypothetical protein